MQFCSILCALLLLHVGRESSHGTKELSVLVLKARHLSGSTVCTGIIYNIGVPDYVQGWLPLGWDKLFWKLSLFELSCI